MFCLVFLILFLAKAAEDEQIISYSCRRHIDDFTWEYDNDCDVQHGTKLVELATHSANYDDDSGTCNLNGEKISILETQVGCPAQTVEEVSRPVQILVKFKAPCDSYKTFGLQPQYASVEVFGLYEIRLNLQDKLIEWKMYGKVEYSFASNVTLYGTIYGDQMGDDDFHELLFDMQEEATILYYNGFLLTWGMSLENSGKIRLNGGSINSWNWILVRDFTCSMECDSRWDCSGHGVTTDLDTSDGCDCECDFNWFGQDCSKQTFIDIGTDKTCDQPPEVRASGATFTSCINFCTAQNYSCNFFAFNHVRQTCETFTECFIEGIDVPGSTVYQKRDMCKLERETIGSMYIKLLDSSGYEDNRIVLYFQFPKEGITLEKLEFKDATHGCSSLVHSCGAFIDYWSELELGCMRILKGKFPTVLYQPEDGWNDFGFIISGNVMTSYLIAEFTQPVLWMGDWTDRKITIAIPWMIVLQTVLVLEASLGGVENICDPPCEGCYICENAECVPVSGDPCDDNLLSTWPDYCDDGKCVGTALTCRKLTDSFTWNFDSSNGELALVKMETYSAGYSNSAQGIGLCLEQGESEEVIHGSSASIEETFPRPAKVTFKTKAPCRMWHEGNLTPMTVIVFEVYAVRINPDGTLEIMLHGEEFISVRSTRIDATAFDDMTGDDAFHEIVIDMRARDVTYFYYNDRRIGESMTFEASGNIRLEGEWHTQVNVQDMTCGTQCDPLYDCSGHGETTDNNAYDGCVCSCHDNWTGDDCSVQIFKDLGETSTCGGVPVDSSSGSLDDCIEFCHSSEECTYFTYSDDTKICALFEECLVEDSDQNTIPYQNQEICELDPTVLGSMHIKLLLSSTFVNDTMILYFQFPSGGITLDELFFNNPTDDKGHYRRWGTENKYWTIETVGCMTIMTGAFPMKEVYDPPFLNSLGLFADSNTLTGELVSKCSQDMVFFGKVIQRRLEYYSPFVLVLQTILELDIDTGVKDVCDGSSCGQCMDCGEGGACQPANEGAQCDDYLQGTYPDRCENGQCIGTPLCEPQSCSECEACIIILDCGGGEPCGKCHPNPSKENALCGDGSKICKNGDCTHIPPPECTENCDEGCDYVCNDASCADQSGFIRPCCHVGFCDQTNSHEPQCYGGGCNQNNATSCSCDGGFCDQLDCTNPTCNGGGCTGNCDFMTPQSCHMCVNGNLIPNNNATCFIPGFDNTHCVDGDCVGDDVRCSSIPPCPPCHTCVAIGADAYCEVDHALEGTICLPPDVVCTSGTCIPPFQIVDSLVVNFGLQESDLTELHSVISIQGITSVRWPWRLIASPNFTVLSSEEFPVISNNPFFIRVNCPKNDGEACVQEWDVSFTVDKICDTVSKYDLLLFADSFEAPDAIASAIWSVSIAQAAVCGMVIQDAPLTGSIKIMNKEYLREITTTSFPLDTTVYFLMDTDGVAPIESVEVLMLSLTYLGQTYMLVGPSVDPVLKEIVMPNDPINERHEVKWSLKLDRITFKDSVMMQIVLTITVRATYLQNDGRRSLAQAVEEPSFQFSQGVIVSPLQCGIPYSFTPIMVRNSIEVDCPDKSKTVFLMCMESGWEDLNSKCADPLVVLPPADETSILDYLMHIIIFLLIIALVAGALIYKLYMEAEDQEGGEPPRFCSPSTPGAPGKPNKSKRQSSGGIPKPRRRSKGGGSFRQNSGSRNSKQMKKGKSGTRTNSGRRNSNKSGGQKRRSRQAMRESQRRNSRARDSVRRSRGESIRAGLGSRRKSGNRSHFDLYE